MLQPRLIYVSSNRALIRYSSESSNPELVYPHGSEVRFVDLSSRDITRRIKIKPKAEKKAREYEISHLSQHVDHSDLVSTSSLSNTLVLKLDLIDIEKRTLLAYYRTDGIVGTVDIKSGREIWSKFFGVTISDFDFSVEKKLFVFASHYGDLIFVDIKGKDRIYEARDLIGHILAVRFVDGNRLLVVFREGVVMLYDLDSKPGLKGTNLHLAEHAVFTDYGEITSVYLFPKKSIMFLGFRNGAILLFNLSESIRDPIYKISLPESIIGIGEFNSRIYCVDWLGNFAIIDPKDLSRISHSIFESIGKRYSDDLDNDGIIENVEIFTKYLRLWKNNTKIFEISGKSYITAAYPFDINDDGKKEIIAGWNSKTLSAYSTIDGHIIFNIKTLTVPRGILVERINNKKRIIIGSHQSIEVYELG